jgi:DNA-binding FadR family transcriptional regulator
MRPVVPQNGKKKPVLDRILAPKSYDVLAEQLRRTILDGELAEGSRLPTERELVSQTGLSRGSVREALRKLEVEGLMRPRLGRFGGNIVSRPDKDSMAQFVGQFIRSRRLPLRSLQETRETIEPALARLAAENRSEEDLALLRSLNRDLATADLDAGQFAAINVEWHNAVAAASRNELMAALLYAMSYGVVAATMDEVYDTLDVHQAVCRAHERVIDAIAARDGDAAFRRMERHVKAMRAQVKQREDSELPLDPPDSG